jgi:serine/threonine protein kinase
MPPLARVRRASRHDSEGLSITVPLSRERASSLAITSPYRRPFEPPPRQPATAQFGPYQIFEQLGVGGMASVHRAELPGAAGFRKSVALKRMHTALTEDHDFVSSFVHEAQLVSRLRHPNIAQAYDLGKIDGTYYIAMELVPGPTLAQVMRQSRYAAGPIPLPIILEVLIQLCDALDHAHDLRDDGGHPLNLIHRDVSPANVIVSSSGTVKLIDFGIAKARSSRVVTEVGVIKGKHAYIAPEYTYGQLDRRADLFGLGVIAHELLTGRRLFLGEHEVDSLRAVREKTIDRPSRFRANISHELDDIVMVALQRDPEQRWQTAGAMRVALVTELRRLGLAASGAQIRSWIEWAFAQPELDAPPDSPSEPSEPTVSGKRRRSARGSTAPTPAGFDPTARLSKVDFAAGSGGLAAVAQPGFDPAAKLFWRWDLVGKPRPAEPDPEVEAESEPVVSRGLQARLPTERIRDRPTSRLLLFLLSASVIAASGWLDLDWWIARLG